MAFFPCFPIRAYWDWSVTDAKCYAFGTMNVSLPLNDGYSEKVLTFTIYSGAKVREPLAAAYESHSVINMVFDIAVLTVPIPMCFRQDRSKREHFAAAGLCTLGSL